MHYAIIKKNGAKVMKNKSLLFLGHFWSYGIFLLTFLLCAIWAVLCLSIQSLEEYAWILFAILGIGFSSTGVDWIIASIFRKSHILLIEQFTTHQKMNIDEISWHEFNPKSHIGAGIVLCVLGIFGIISAIIIAM